MRGTQIGLSFNVHFFLLNRAVNLCKAFSFSKECTFQFSTLALCNPGMVKELLDHMKSEHKYTVASQVGWNELTSLAFNQAQLNLVTRLELATKNCAPVYQEVILRSKPASSSEIFVLLIVFEKDPLKQILFSFAFAMLTSETEGAKFRFLYKLKKVPRSPKIGAMSVYQI